jgi:serine/threonine-protein kinase HipA
VLLAQEDGCQALGRYPADKYNLEAEAVAQALVRITRARPVAGRDLLAQLVFAYLTGNGDAHAKNFSVGQRPDGEWRVTPAYDLPSTHPYGDHTMALGVNGKRREDIGRGDFLALASAVGLRERAAAGTIDDLVDRSDQWIARLDELPFDERRIHKLHKAVEYRRERLRRG